MNALFTLTKKKKKKDNTNQNQIEVLTSHILKGLLKDRATRACWIELLEKPDNITSDTIFDKRVEDSFKDWLMKEEQKKSSFPSKVVELLNVSHILDRNRGKRSRELQLDNDVWTSSDVEDIDKHADPKLQLWEKVFSYMKNIPQKTKLDTKNMEKTSEELCRNFEYCLRCRLWFQHKSLMRPDLRSLLTHMCTSLAQDSMLFSIKLCKFLTHHLEHICDLVSPSTELEQPIASIRDVIHEYEQFSKSIGKFNQTQASGYLNSQDLSTSLNTLAEESRTWEYQSFVQVKQHYVQDLQVLTELDSIMDITLRLQQSVAFGDIWSECNAKCKDLELPKTPFAVFKQVFKDSKSMWDNYAE
ncbi:hypothetical protein RFI_24457, partial [Reticulomyxa filosa]